MHHTLHALAIAERLAADLAPSALGIALFGSVAQGTDHPHSDIDLFLAVESGAGTEIRQVEGRMVTLSRKTLTDLEGAFTSPWEAVVAVGAWRRARLLHDPEGHLARLQARAHAWTWDLIGPGADHWAAGELVGLAEEVHKTRGMLERGRTRAAAANRAILVLQLGYAMSVANRLVCDTENDLWDAVAAAEGPAWAAAWDAAAGITPAGHEDGCRAALALYRHAAARLATHLDGDAAAIVTTACDLTAT
ncbi:nucleotidyltransferase domain-containing protein [Glycomyces tritici]|uniref:Nucleotidyltransferase domain-containing protein n=1 Tax=Glycomyces tritici TaxID=2665176 RepID=A0ABT7YVZ6_9ACTN|nr:nucleotidyltransferase domain-containing protein [Glycomyces tritici]MDN3242790.1 nucleotidyltransferase domain-containing protein [Glycomyces tritici]